MRTKPVTTLNQQATKLLSDIKRDKEPILITRHGLPGAYPVDVALCERMQQRMNFLEGIIIGEQAIAAGHSATHSQAKARLSRWLK